MYGPSIERQFGYIEFEIEQMRRENEIRHLLEAAQPSEKPPRRSLVNLFGRFVPRLDARVSVRRSPATQI